MSTVLHYCVCVETGATPNERKNAMEEIVEQIARHLFVDAWARLMASRGRTFPEMKLEDVAPEETDFSATCVAHMIALDFLLANDLKPNELEDIVGNDVEEFGYLLAMQSQDHGSGLFGNPKYEHFKVWTRDYDGEGLFVEEWPTP